MEFGWELDVLNDAEHGRWIASLGDEATAKLSCGFVGGRVVLLTIWVGPAYRKNRVATELVSRVLDEIRESGKKIGVVPRSPAQAAVGGRRGTGETATLLVRRRCGSALIRRTLTPFVVPSYLRVSRGASFGRSVPA
ncbi:GNAT family N-acetyltransferase [Streptomyces mirabilis]|uniref:GNAT family N-acetyltransferase n=1 Tax=Streptomyces mirabilis TaxID=68239 RepID=UPI00364FD7C4